MNTNGQQTVHGTAAIPLQSLFNGQAEQTLFISEVHPDNAYSFVAHNDLQPSHCASAVALH